MTRPQANPANPSSPPTAGQSDRFVFPSWLFVTLAILWFLFLILVGFLVVVAVAYRGAESHPWAGMFDRGWGLISAAALLWGLVNLSWANQASRIVSEDQRSRAYYGHFSIVLGCGLIVLGIHGVLLARSYGLEPIIMDYSHPAQKTFAIESGHAAQSLVAGDAEEGRKVFSTTCITCHGPTGGGLSNLAPSLRGSPFIAAADDGAIANVIRLGRAIADPDNKTKKVMPARGGNPFLGDDKIAHLVAFVRAIQSESAAVGSDSGDPEAPPPVQLAKWVLPPPPAPPAGLVSLDFAGQLGDAAGIQARSQGRRQQLAKIFTLGLTGIHGLFLVGLMIASSNLLLRGLRDHRVPVAISLPQHSVSNSDAWWSLAAIGWMAAAVAWLVVFVLGWMVAS